MNTKEIKKEASEFEAQNRTELSDKVLELKNKGVSFLGCVAFVQTNLQLSLAEARKMTLSLECWSNEEKVKINSFHKLMLSEFEDKEG